MIKLFENRVVTQYMNFETNTVHTIWNAMDITSKEFRESVKNYIVDEYKFTNIFSDTRKMGPISPEDQEWINTDVFPLYVKAGLKKFAILLPEEIFGKFSVEEIFINVGGYFDVQYFNSEEEALNWLK